MIPVILSPEPSTFDVKVRQKGLKWLKAHAIPLSGALPANTAIPPYWRDCMPELHQAYSGICAYLGIFFPRSFGTSVDHFAAKSKDISQAYEWKNYRFSSALLNSRKREFSDVLDPVGLKKHWFHLDLITCQIFPNPGISVADQKLVQDTIDRLGLDEPECRAVRADWFEAYCSKEITKSFLKKKAPFVYEEAYRQGELK